MLMIVTGVAKVYTVGCDGLLLTPPLFVLPNLTGSVELAGVDGVLVVTVVTVRGCVVTVRGVVVVPVPV